MTIAPIPGSLHDAEMPELVSVSLRLRTDYRSVPIEIDGNLKLTSNSTIISLFQVENSAKNIPFQFQNRRLSTLIRFL